MKPSLDAIKTLLPKVQEEKARILKFLSDGAARVAKLKQERSDLLNCRINKTDYVALICADIDRRATEHGARYGRIVQREAKQSSYYPATVKSALTMRDSPLACPPVSPVHAPVVDSWQSPREAVELDVAWWLLAEPMKAAVRKAAESAEGWPFEETTDAAKALERIDAIDAEIEALQAREAELRAEAEAIGLDLSAA